MSSTHTALFASLVLLLGCTKSVFKMNEKYRPQIHFSPKKNWMNDPNGLVYQDGTYHLFFQYYPEDIVWGPMHWGHATSKDLLHWEEKPIALYPDSLGYIFSGSAVMDWKNTSGLGTLQNPPMVAVFTYHDSEGEKADAVDFQTQGIAYSLDNGKSWAKYAKNPVLKNPGIRDFRDPKVIWLPEYEKWVMALAVKDRISFYSTFNLIDWTFESSFGQDFSTQQEQGVWECPDLFPLLDAEGKQKWILIVSVNKKGVQEGSGTEYFVGNFDGQQFIPDDTSIRWLDQGADNYAGVTFSDIPEEDGRRILIGWMSNWEYAQEVPSQAWRSAMTLPRALYLFKDNNDVYQVKTMPIEEISSLQEKTPIAFTERINAPTDAYKISLGNIEKKTFSLLLKNDLGEYCKIHVLDNRLHFDRTQSGATDFNENFARVHSFDFSDISLEKIDIYVDRSSVELFLNDGEKAMTEIVFPNEPYQIVEIESGTEIQASLTPLCSIWRPVCVESE